MTAVLSFNVLGVAIPYIRVSPGRKRGNVYEDRAYAHWKSLVTDAAREAAERAQWTTTLAAVRCDVTFVVVRRPTKTKRPQHEHPISGKGVGDVENLAKGVFDALTKAGVFRDDKQIVASVLMKRWQARDEEFAGVIVHVEIM